MNSKEPSSIAKSIIQEDIIKILEQVDPSPLQGKRVLVTGTNGLLGGYLLAYLATAIQKKKISCEVRCISKNNPNQYLREYLDGVAVTFETKDLGRPFDLNEHYDIVFHAAGYSQPKKFIENPLETVKINIDATLSLIERVIDGGTFVFFSSAETYGDIPADRIPVSETYRGEVDTTGKRAVYAEAKRLGEAIVSSVERARNIKARILRISHTYGPGITKNDTRLMGDILRMAEEGRIVLQDEGRAIKTFGYVGDTTAMILYAALYGKERVYNIGGKDSLSVAELAGQIGQAYGVPVSVENKKNQKAHIGEDPQIVRLDMTRLEKEMGQIPYTSIKEGLRRLISWYKTEQK